MAQKYTLDEVRHMRMSYHRTHPNVCREIFWEDIDKIADAVCAFADVMRDEMFDKAADGYQGWDNIEDKEQLVHIKKELAAHIKKKNYVGAANFCMMLHLHKSKGKTK